MKQRFSASVCLEDDCCVASQGNSEREALENLREAIGLHFEIPNPTPLRPECGL